MAKGQLATTPRYARATVGDDWALGFTLWDNGAVKDVSAATIDAAILDQAGNEIISDTALLSTATGATWASGAVIVNIPSATTLALAPGEYRLVIQTTIAGNKTTWPFIPVEVQKGLE